MEGGRLILIYWSDELSLDRVDQIKCRLRSSIPYVWAVLDSENYLLLVDSKKIFCCKESCWDYYDFCIYRSLQWEERIGATHFNRNRNLNLHWNNWEGKPKQPFRRWRTFWTNNITNPSRLFLNASIIHLKHV